VKLLAARRAVAALAALALIAASGWFAAAARARTVFQVSVGAAHGRPVPSGFLGLSLEYRSIPMYTGSDPAAVNPVFLQLIRNLVPSGRPVFRIGGQSTDRTWWPVRGVSRPLGVTYALTPRWMASARALAQDTDARYILGLGLEANRPALAAVEAQQLVSGVGRQYIRGFEIGNEPELYTVVPWYRTLHHAPIPWYSKLGVPVLARPRGYAPDAFYADFSRTLRALPALPIAGPATGLVPWLSGFRRFLTRTSPVKTVTWHAYGLNQCVTDRSSPLYPTVPNLLLPPTSRGVVHGISPDVALAHRLGESFRIDEMNSVTCNGRVGVSNTFASALWLIDALFAIAADGVDGADIHTYPDAANGLFDFDRAGGQWQAAVHPLYYGALMFAQAAPAGSRLLRIGSGPQHEVRAWATLAPDRRIRVLLINDSLSHSVLAQVSARGAAGPASIERLAARSAYATSGITLGGRTFGVRTKTGALAPPQPKGLARRSGAYAVPLPAASAALLTFRPRGG
jgi:hypothetical protein